MKREELNTVLDTLIDVTTLEPEQATQLQKTIDILVAEDEKLTNTTQKFDQLQKDYKERFFTSTTPKEQENEKPKKRTFDDLFKKGGK